MSFELIKNHSNLNFINMYPLKFHSEATFALAKIAVNLQLFKTKNTSRFLPYRSNVVEM